MILLHGAKIAYFMKVSDKRTIKIVPIIKQVIVIPHLINQWGFLFIIASNLLSNFSS